MSMHMHRFVAYDTVPDMRCALRSVLDSSKVEMNNYMQFHIIINIYLIRPPKRSAEAASYGVARRMFVRSAIVVNV